MAIQSRALSYYLFESQLDYDKSQRLNEGKL